MGCVVKGHKSCPLCKIESFDFFLKVIPTQWGKKCVSHHTGPVSFPSRVLYLHFSSLVCGDGLQASSEWNYQQNSVCVCLCVCVCTHAFHNLSLLLMTC